MNPSNSKNPRLNWAEYGMEAAGLGLFMISASAFGVLLEHPASQVRNAIASADLRRALMGLAMGLTAIALIYSPWGKRSGAHYNPAVTITFFRLGKVARADLAGYIIAQVAGGALGMIAAAAVLGAALANPAVNYVATLPTRGAAVAFAGEAIIAFVMMTTVLWVSNTPRLARFTGVCAGACVALFITFEAPFSGMSLNPARTFASAIVAGDWTGFWIYLTAPLAGMIAASLAYPVVRSRAKVACAKLDHAPGVRCLFCEHQQRKLVAAR